MNETEIILAQYRNELSKLRKENANLRGRFHATLRNTAKLINDVSNFAFFTPKQKEDLQSSVKTLNQIADEL